MMRPQPSDGFVWVQAAGGPALVCGPLRPLADHLFTTRDWALGSGLGSDDEWAPVAGSVGVDLAHLVRLRQVHGAGVVVRRLGDPLPSGWRPEADIVVSNDPRVAIAIQTADCVPLLIADSRTGAVAAAHGGWRGLAAGVPSAAVAALAREFDARPTDLVVAVGPSISAPAYEVGPDVAERFTGAGFDGDRLARWFSDGDREGRWQFDGWQAAADQLAAAGVPSHQIHIAGLCTAAYPSLFCSYRRDGKGAGRMAAAIRCRGDG
jgi:purine-nucleoside/S-methyl-5'-thioadenosine phosphorylase / adenosine deaminase